MSDAKADLRDAALARRRDMVSDATRSDFAKRLAIVGPALIRRADDPLAEPIVSLFLPIRNEPDTRPLLDVLSGIGITTALPVAGRRGTPLTFRRWAPGEPLVRGRWQIEEPAASAAVVEPEVLFVPLAAFDRRGARLGYGGGYYDATLAALRRTSGARGTGPVRAIGIAFACQETLYVPTDLHDEPLDLVVTERDVILCEP